MTPIVCVLRSGGSYGPQHVQWLQAQRPGLWLTCLSDVDVPGVRTVPLRHGWPGWWSKIEVFGSAISGDLLYLDLDSVITSPLEPLLTASETTLCSDFLRPRYANSSVMYVAQKDKATVYERFLESPDAHMNHYRKWPAKWGDQGFIADSLPGAARWPQGLVRSYRAECTQGVPDGTRVVTFHGVPKPWACKADWIPPMKVAA